ncbi:GNAT family N-acetyltransferase [Rhodocytophaga rosea]|uniref:GNAT family N-acetyltransferase n=1 Tax=Rhodocytophaga rosea TaxID=2704465 RepID=A0A6C0GC55_9BACT|nr:GNAT family N-acetyltransferase [Rhodocytophaga rosea]QHT65559.1 GNAT family N-acetyltransferase [Rhodocytophaga rosea]
MRILLREDFNIDKAAVISLYQSNDWSSAKKPDLLFQGLMHSHSLITAWAGEQLVGLGNALSDGFLVVYYPHLLVHPAYQGQGIGRMIMNKMQEKYGHFHQQVLVADGRAVDFYQKCGFVKAGETQSMWIYQGTDHEEK